MEGRAIWYVKPFRKNHFYTVVFRKLTCFVCFSGFLVFEYIYISKCILYGVLGKEHVAGRELKETRKGIEEVSVKRAKLGFFICVLVAILSKKF